MSGLPIFNRNVIFYVALPACLFLAMGLYIFPDFDVFYDEVYETTMARDNVALFLDYIKLREVHDPYGYINNNLEFYGTFINLLAYVFQNLISDSQNILSMERLEIKRYVIFLFSFLGYGALTAAIYAVTRSRFSAWSAFGILGLMPMYFYHSFNNPKDVPFAVMMTVANAVGAYSVARALQNPALPLNRQQIYWLVAAGVAIGLCASIRIAGVVTLGYWGLALIICATQMRVFDWKRLSSISCIVAAVAFGVIYILHPVSYANPIGWMFEALQYHAHHPHPSRTLTDGEWIYSGNTPWYYLPKWLYAKIPILWQFLCGVGIVYSLVDFRKHKPVAQALIVGFLLQLTFLPLTSMVIGSKLYDDCRHFIFVCPAIAFFSAIAIWKITQYPKYFAMIAMTLVTFMAVKISSEMAALHPYESAYFIEPIRGNILDNWSYGDDRKNSIFWFHKNTDADTLYVPYDRKRMRYFVNLMGTRHIKVYKMYPDSKIKRPFYFMDYGDYRYSADDWRAQCATVHKVTRWLGNTPLTFSLIKYCS